MPPAKHLLRKLNGLICLLLAGAYGRVKKALAGVDKPLRIAVMGCIVNGPGEAADADLAVCCAKNKGYIYCKGRKKATVAENKIIPALLKELQNL